MTESETRSAPLGLRIRPSLKVALEKLALEDKRTLAGYIEIILEDHVERQRGKAPGKRKWGIRLTDAEMKKIEQSAQRLEAEARRLRGLVSEEVSRRRSRDNKPAAKRKWTHIGRNAMNANIWLIVVVVLVVLSVILAIMDRSFLSPMYLLVLALVVMVGTSVKFPW
jgi:hypothetical protein